MGAHRSRIAVPQGAVLILTLIMGCGRDRVAGQTEQIDSRGDSLLPWSIVLERVLQRQPSAREGGETWFAGLHSGLVAADSTGGIYILDGVTGRVVVFPSHGRETYWVGSRGGGPGEFAAPVALGVGADGHLWVWDLDKRALVRFSPAGVPLGERRVDGVYAGGPVVVRGDAVTLATIDRVAGAGQLRVRLATYDSVGTVHHLALTSPLPKGLQIPGCQVPLPLRRRFLPRMIWGAHPTGIVGSTTPEYRLAFMEGSATRMVLGRLVPPIAARRDSALDDLREDPVLRRVAGLCEISLGALLDEIGYEREMQTIHSVALTPSGEMWVRRWTPGGFATDVFTSAGYYLGTLARGVPDVVTFLGEDRFASILESDSGQQVAVYGVHR